MILYIARHAWAEERDDAAWPDDDLRPLTRAGRERFAQFVKRLAGRIEAPQWIATSPLVRCRQTAEILAARLPGEAVIASCEALAPGSDLESMVARTEREAAGANAVAWVGHAPDVGLLTARLIGDGHGAVHFAKGALAAIEFPSMPFPGGGELLWLATAKLLRC